MEQDLDQLINELDRRLNQSSRFYMRAVVRMAQKQMQQAVMGDLETKKAERSEPDGLALPRILRQLIHQQAGSSVESGNQEKSEPATPPTVIDGKWRDISDEE